jgi:hypothetical protein
MRSQIAGRQSNPVVDRLPRHPDKAVWRAMMKKVDFFSILYSCVIATTKSKAQHYF